MTEINSWWSRFSTRVGRNFLNSRLGQLRWFTDTNTDTWKQHTSAGFKLQLLRSSDYETETQSLNTWHPTSELIHMSRLTWATSAHIHFFNWSQTSIIRYCHQPQRLTLNWVSVDTTCQLTFSSPSSSGDFEMSPWSLHSCQQTHTFSIMLGCYSY